MGLQAFLKSGFEQSLETFDAETVTIGSESFLAIIDEKTSARPLGVGAQKDERTLVIQFVAGAFTGALSSGQEVTARGEAWQISAEPDGIRTGQAAVTITLVEPDRRADF
jgi:hypothetical protein